MAKHGPGSPMWSPRPVPGAGLSDRPGHPKGTHSKSKKKYPDLWARLADEFAATVTGLSSLALTQVSSSQQSFQVDVDVTIEGSATEQDVEVGVRKGLYEALRLAGVTP